MSATLLPIEHPDLESSTEDYARRFQGATGRYFLDVQWDIVSTMLPSPGSCHVLDIGGGHAQLTAPMVRAGYDVTVVGSDDSCVARLDRAIGAEQYRYVVGDLLDLPLEPKSFDVVLAFRLLPHLKDWRRFVAELCRVSNRTVIFDYPDLRSINRLSPQLFAAKQSIEKNTRVYRCFRRQEVTDALAANQFQVESFQGQFLFPMALHRLLRLAAISRASEELVKRIGLTRLLGSPVILKASRK